MTRHPEFLTVDDVVNLHAAVISRYGGLEGIRDVGMLESAVMTPQDTFSGDYLHHDVFEMAAAYAFHIAQNQPFPDGNKRAGLLSALVFLDLNGFTYAKEDSELYQAMIKIATGEMSKDELACMFRANFE